MDIYEARNNLVDVLFEVVGESLTYEYVVSELRLSMGDKTVARFSGENSMPLAQWERLVSHLSELEAGLSSLTKVLERYLGNKINWPRFIAAADKYCIYIEKGRPGDGRFSTTLGRECLIQRDQLRKQLHSLSSTYHDVSPARLERCLNSAMNTCHPNLPRSQVYPPVFSQGPIKSWAMLLDLTTQFDQYFEEKFLEILAENLSSNQEEPPPIDDPIGSLVIMLLQPLSKSNSDTYSFRAYYCGHKAAAADQWVKIFDPAADYQIKHSDWRHKLEALLPKLLCEARGKRESDHEKLLLEIFLPTELIDAELHTLKLSLVSDREKESLGDRYPIVARSAWGYQTFVERKHEATSDSPLISRWRHRSKMIQSGKKCCFWWHDSGVRSDGEQDRARIDPKRYFNDLRAFHQFFGMKRLEAIPMGTFYETWKDKLMDASPAIALWWRPDSSSQLEHRESIFHPSRQENGFSLFGNSQSDPENPQSDPFEHPDVSDPLKLFFALASAVYRGQFKEGACGQAFREMVLLVDSHDRWPPPLERSPVSQDLADRSDSVVVDAEEMLMIG
jgi:hypothetical protein